MNKNLKSRLMDNLFADRLRLKLEVNFSEYQQLCQDLEALAEEWKNEKLIDKELIGYLYVMPTAIVAMSSEIPEHQDELKQMSIEIDDLLLICLDTGLSFDDSRYDNL